MFSRLFWAVVFVAFALHVVLAQDPTKVEPKRYKLAFENDWVQVVNVHYGPHEKSVMHDHPGGVVVVLTAAHLRFTGQDGKIKEVYAKPGESRWYPPFKHQVENLGDTSYDAVYIGIKSKSIAGNRGSGSPGSKPQPPLDAQTAKIVASYLASTSR